jgi:hypothetical protein
MLLQLVDLVLPSVTESASEGVRQRGRPVVYSETIIVKALIIMVVR